MSAVPTGAPSVRLTPLSPTVLLVTWGKLPPEQARGTIIGYKIQWRKPIHHYYHVIEVFFSNKLFSWISEWGVCTCILFLTSS